MTMTDSKWYSGVEHFSVGQQLRDLQHYLDFERWTTGMNIDLSRNSLWDSCNFPKSMELNTVDHIQVRVGDGARPLIKAAVRSKDEDYKGDFPPKMLVVTDIDHSAQKITAMYQLSDDILGIVTIDW